MLCLEGAHPRFPLMRWRRTIEILVRIIERLQPRPDQCRMADERAEDKCLVAARDDGLVWFSHLFALTDGSDRIEPGDSQGRDARWREASGHIPDPHWRILLRAVQGLDQCRGVSSNTASRVGASSTASSHASSSCTGALRTRARTAEET